MILCLYIFISSVETELNQTGLFPPLLEQGTKYQIMENYKYLTSKINIIV